MPTALSSMMKARKATVKVLRSSSRWVGVTQREDRAAAAAFFATVPSPVA
jgi:hypothetical protein